MSQHLGQKSFTVLSPERCKKREERRKGRGEEEKEKEKGNVRNTEELKEKEKEEQKKVTWVVRLADGSNVAPVAKDPRAETKVPSLVLCTLMNLK